MPNTDVSTSTNLRTKLIAGVVIMALGAFGIGLAAIGYLKYSQTNTINRVPDTHITITGIVYVVVMESNLTEIPDQIYLQTEDQQVLLNVPSDVVVPKSGTGVSVSGEFRDDESFQVATISAVNDATASTEMVPATSATTTTLAQTYNVLVVMGYYPEQGVPTTPTTNDVQAVMFGSSPSVADFYHDNSFGNVTITGTVIGWVPLAGAETSNIWSSTTMALQAAKISNPSLNLQQFQHVVLISPYTATNLPDGYSVIGPISVSSPDGTLLVGAEMMRSTILNLPRTTLLLPYILIHEFGHGLGLGHAGLLGCTDVSIATTCRVMEYGDRFDVMGGAYELTYAENLNAVHLDKLGWFSPSNLQVVDVSPGHGGTFTLEPIENRTTGLKALKIPRGNNDFFYVEYRQSIGYDTALDDPALFTGALLHVINQGGYPNSLASDTLLIDATPPAFIKQNSLTVGMSLTDPITGVVITTTAQDANGVTVRVDPATNPITTDLPPTVTITAPQGGTTVTSPVTFTATIDDDHGVSTSRFYVDCPETSALSWCTYTYQGHPYEMAKTLTDGAHSIQVTADDYTGHRTTSSRVAFVVGSVQVVPPTPTVQSPPPPVVPTPPIVPSPATVSPPTITVLGLINGTIAVGQRTTFAISGDVSTISTAVLKVDRKTIVKKTKEPFSFYVDSPAYPNGKHAVSVIVTQKNGTVTTKNITVTTNNALSVNISSPVKNAAVKKTVTINPVVRGGYGTKSIVYTLDGKKLATKTKSPFSYAWNTAKTSRGWHTVKVKVTDKKGKTATVSVKVKVTR